MIQLELEKKEGEGIIFNFDEMCDEFIDLINIAAKYAEKDADIYIRHVEEQRNGKD